MTTDALLIRTNGLRVEDAMDVNDRLTRLEDALIDLALVVTEGHIGRLDAHIAPDVVEAGKRLQSFHHAVVKERAS